MADASSSVERDCGVFWIVKMTTAASLQFKECAQHWSYQTFDSPSEVWKMHLEAKVTEQVATIPSFSRADRWRTSLQMKHRVVVGKVLGKC